MPTLLHKSCPLAYDIRGDGDPVILLQGVGLHGDGWLPQTNALSSQFRCVTIDNRGMGRSQPPAGPITVEQLAEDTLAIMDNAGIRQAHIAGHSLGGVIALHIALTARTRVKSLALLCTSARGADATRFDPAIVWPGIRSRVGTKRMRRHAFLEIILPPEVLATQNRDELAATLEPYFGHDLGEMPPIVDQQLNALKRYDATPRLHELQGIPTLVISAEKDLIFPPRYGKALAKGIPDARYEEIPNAAHGVTIQKTPLVNQILSGFWKL
jgi:pimeloyl-ACP methyl ester carboxylesterase